MTTNNQHQTMARPPLAWWKSEIARLLYYDVFLPTRIHHLRCMGIGGCPQQVRGRSHRYIMFHALHQMHGNI